MLKSRLAISMQSDMITNMRTEWVSTKLCTNQTPRDANVVLQLGCYDGRAIYALPRTIKKLITSSTEADGEISISVQRQLKQQKEYRFKTIDGSTDVESDFMEVVIKEQRADDLKLVEDETVDVVISLQSAEKMQANGLDWKRSINETIRVLKPGGRLLFVEQTALGYLDYVKEMEGFIWESVGYDDIDLVLVPHVAGVAIKDLYAGLTQKERFVKEKKLKEGKYADDIISAFESRGRRRRKKKKKSDETNDDSK